MIDIVSFDRQHVHYQTKKEQFPEFDQVDQYFLEEKKLLFGADHPDLLETNGSESSFESCEAKQVRFGHFGLFF